MAVENISWSISTKECCRPWWGLNPPVSSRTAHPTEPPRLAETWLKHKASSDDVQITRTELQEMLMTKNYVHVHSQAEAMNSGLQQKFGSLTLFSPKTCRWHKISEILLADFIFIQFLAAPLMGVNFLGVNSSLWKYVFQCLRILYTKVFDKIPYANSPDRDQNAPERAV